jgi:predicted DNA-binding transcriptional regulator AlpA
MPKHDNAATPSDFIVIDEILVLLKEHLNLDVGTSAVYNYTVRKNFPKHIGLGSPRKYRRKDVMEWIRNYTA